MKHQTHIFVFFALLALGLVSCSDSEKSSGVQVVASDTTNLPPKGDSLVMEEATETFSGTCNDQEIIFRQKNYQTYSLKIGDQVTNGVLNTEKGYGDDRDATVYVLDSDKPKKDQRYFVRTPKGTIYMLDQDRYVVDEAVFNPVAGAEMKSVENKPPPAIQPEATDKPVVKETPKKKTESKKAATTKSTAAKTPATKASTAKASEKKATSTKSSGKETAKKSASTEKAPAKKTSKATKKKKSSKKAAKKKSTKKKKARKNKKKSTKTASSAPTSTSGK